MIKTYFCGDENETYEEINKYVNKNLEHMVKCYIDFSEDNSELSNIFPAYKYEDNSKFGQKTLNELYNIIKSDIERGVLKPKYKFLLKCIIEYFLDLQEDGEIFEFLDIDDRLKAQIKIYDKVYIDEGYDISLIREITSLERYKESCFTDWDFDHNLIDMFVNEYIENVNYGKSNGYLSYLDEYIDIMSPDLRELYVECREKCDINTLESEIVLKVYSSLRLLEHNVLEIFYDDETKISNQIYRMIGPEIKTSLNVEVNREKPIGRALSKLGEADLYFYKNEPYYKDIAIFENKILEKFKDAFNQLQGYINQNFEFGATISINRKKTISNALEYIKEILNNYENTEIIIDSIEEKPFGVEYPYVLKSVCSVPEDNKKKINIYHLILNLNDSSRVKVAREARIKPR